MRAKWKRHQIGHVYHAYDRDFIILEYKYPEKKLSSKNTQVKVRFIDDGSEMWLHHMDYWEYVGPGLSNSQLKDSLTRLEE